MPSGNENEAIWHLAEVNGQAHGPYVADQVRQFMRVRRVNERTLCWREGMIDWQPLGQTEPFNTERQRTRTPTARPATKSTLRLFLVAFLVGAGVLVYLYVGKDRDIGRAEELVAAGRYTEASRILSVYAKEHPNDNQATYLWAVARLHEYAMSQPTPPTGRPAIERSQGLPQRTGRRPGYTRNDSSEEGRARQPVGRPPVMPAEIRSHFTRSLAANPKWVERAKTDVREAARRVPLTAGDYFAKSLAMAQLQADLRLATETELAATLLNGLERATPVQPHREIPRDLLSQVLTWDLSTSDRVIALLVDNEDPSSAASAGALQRWQEMVEEVPAFAGRLSAWLINRSAAYVEQGHYDRAEQMLSAAEQVDPACTPQAVHRRVAYIRLMLSQGRGPEAVAVLDNSDHSRPEMSQLAGELYLQAARTMADSHREGASDALQKAMQYAPEILQDEDDEFLYIRVTPASRMKLAHCGAFLRRYPDSRHEVTVLRVIVRDATTQIGMQGPVVGDLGDYGAEGLDAAGRLLKEHPGAPGSHEEIAELVGKLDRDGRLSDARDVIMAMLDAQPEPGIKGRMEQFRDRLPSPGQFGPPPEPDYRKPPSTPEEIQPPESGRPNPILTAADLNKALSMAPRPGILWVAVARENLDKDTIQQLKKWVTDGGVLWVETNVYMAFGLPEFRKDATASAFGVARVAPETHPIVIGVAPQPVRYELGQDGMLIEGELIAAAKRGFVPLLFEYSPRRGMVKIICAIREYGHGYVVFRPRKMEQDSEPSGKAFERSLLEFCLKPYKVRIQWPEPVRQRVQPRARPSVPRR